MTPILPSVTPSASPSASPTPAFSNTPPAFVLQTPTAKPTPVGQLSLVTLTPTHGQPITFTEMEPNVEVYVNSNFLGDTNDTGSFTVTFPNAGRYSIQVGDYPAQIIIVQ